MPKRHSVIYVTTCCERPWARRCSEREIPFLHSFTLLRMRLPEELCGKVAEIGARVRGAELKKSSRRLSDDYRAGMAARALREETERIAYLMVRMPGTYAAVRAAFRAAKESRSEFAPVRLLDLGTGPGTALWAAGEEFPSLQKLEGVERDGGFVSLGRELAKEVASVAIREADWHNSDLRSWKPEKKYDLVVASYSLGELSVVERKQVLLSAWGACDGLLAVVEPGTRRGFEAIAEIRDWLIGAGATLAAPCPHALECPMKAAGDWCHFSVRVERSADHRRLKEGELAYEDEKFSYVIGSRLPARTPAARIVRHPMRYSGYTRLKLCTVEGLKQETVTRSQKERYREAKRAEWGSGWNEE